MKLLSIHVTDFKSVRDSNKVMIGDVTCLVGKNESGKTALLEAIYRLNPIIESDGVFDVTDDYPRADVEDYQQSVEDGTKQIATAITADYELSDEIIASIEESYGLGVLTSKVFSLSRGYDTGRTVSVGVDESTAVKAMIARHSLPESVSNEAQEKTTLHELKTYLEGQASQQAAAVTTATDKANQLTDEAAKAKALLEAQALNESSEAKSLRDDLATIEENKGISLHLWVEYIKPHVPKFLYFDDYYQMEGHVNIEKLKERVASNALKASDRPMLGLIDLARLDLDQLLNPNRTEALVNKLEGASNHLSKQVLKYWSQNKHLQVKFDVRPAQVGDPEGMREGTNLWGRVHDSVHLVSTQLGTRSKGFVWFFSFLAWFSQQKKQDQPLILLLDEPGLFLHAKAQGDLLRYIEEELKPHHQVIYSTHSPFMVDAHHFDRVRIVEDKSMEADDELPEDKQGTKVLTEILEASEDSLFPLQGALGYDIAQTLFVGPNCLIVEGVSDLLYLSAISAVLEKADRQRLSPKWTITPVGGADKVPAFCSLLGSQKGITLATLIDFQNKDTQKIENLYKKKLLKKKNVITFAAFVEGDEADIEDMFDTEFYLKLVNAEFAGEMNKSVENSDISSSADRIIVRLEEYFKSNSLKKGGYGHYRPARYFVEHLGELETELSEATLKRFEDAFKVLNSLLRK